MSLWQRLRDWLAGRLDLDGDDEAAREQARAEVTRLERTLARLEAQRDNMTRRS